MNEKTLKAARGLNSIADPSAFRGVSARKKNSDVIPLKRGSEESVEKKEPVHLKPVGPKVVSPVRDKKKETKTENDSGKRIRRELSIPIPLAEMLEQTGINPADMVMQAYKNHSDKIYAGDKNRKMYKGRSRLRISVTDGEFEQISRLGQSRGWNRSETITVLLEAELNE